MKSSTKYLSLVGLVLSLAACGTPQQMPDMETSDAAADSQQMIQEDSSRAADVVSEETTSSPEDSSVESDASDSGANISDSSDSSTDSGSLVREPNVVYRIGPSVIQFETSNSMMINALFIRRRDYGGSDAGTCQYIAKTSIETSTGTCPVFIRILDTQVQLGDGGTSARVSFTAEYGRCFDRAIGSPVIRLETPSNDRDCPGVGIVDYSAPINISVRWE
jgi:predicted small lipoprotein YifL